MGRTYSGEHHEVVIGMQAFEAARRYPDVHAEADHQQPDPQKRKSLPRKGVHRRGRDVGPEAGLDPFSARQPSQDNGSKGFSFVI